MNTLLDGRSWQAALHTGAVPRPPDYPQHTGRRLTEFMAMIERVVGEPPHVSNLPLTAKQLAAVDLLVILTRRRDKPRFRFSQKEYQGIEDHLSSGGALLLMTNHAPLAENDRQLIHKIAAQYGVSVYGREGFLGQGGTRIGSDDIRPHSITEGVSAMYFRTSHILTCRSHEDVNILATIPGRAAPNNVFALAIDGAGRIVLGADSGFICDESGGRETGYIDHEDNRRYTRQLLEWLCGKR